MMEKTSEGESTTGEDRGGRLFEKNPKGHLVTREKGGKGVGWGGVGLGFWGLGGGGWCGWGLGLSGKGVLCLKKKKGL